MAKKEAPTNVPTNFGADEIAKATAQVAGDDVNNYNFCNEHTGQSGRHEWKYFVAGVVMAFGILLTIMVLVACAVFILRGS
jgi:heme/copper-type cytochrome/quinol oxidase subunit 2